MLFKSSKPNISCQLKFIVWIKYYKNWLTGRWVCFAGELKDVDCSMWGGGGRKAFLGKVLDLPTRGDLGVAIAPSWDVTLQLPELAELALHPPTVGSLYLRQ